MYSNATFRSFIATGAFAFALLSPNVHATLETITIGTATGNISGGPYATVTLDDHGSTGSVHVTISALSGFGLVDTGAGDPLLFNLNGDPLLVLGVNLLNLTSGFGIEQPTGDRKSTRLNSSHMSISYAVFCLKKKT